jgi:hypothetical protein
MNHFTALMIGFFCGVGCFYSGSSMVMEMNSRKVAALRESVIEYELAAKYCSPANNVSKTKIAKRTE